jgi:phosphatidylserine/phosphatidylglycerophosphate/cardiolipin synthase-like enzyme
MKILLNSKAIRSAISAVKPTKIAVAYVGQGWEKYVSDKHLTEIVLSPTFGSNPKAIRALIEKLTFAKVHFLDKLHSKIYIGMNSAFIGSANLSNNGMSDAGLFESGVLLDDQGLIDKLNAKFNEYRTMAKESYPTKEAKLKQLLALEKQTRLAEWNGIPVDGSSRSAPRESILPGFRLRT